MSRLFMKPSILMMIRSNIKDWRFRPKIMFTSHWNKMSTWTCRTEKSPMASICMLPIKQRASTVSSVFSFAVSENAFWVQGREGKGREGLRLAKYILGTQSDNFYLLFRIICFKMHVHVFFIRNHFIRNLYLEGEKM